MEPSGALIRLEQAVKVYRMGGSEVRALDGVELEIGEGDFVAVMGASGSGKSTLMNIIGCLDHLTSGRYLLQGKEISGLDRNARAEIRNRRVGFVFQSFNLLPRTSAIENVELPLVYANLPSRERLRRAREALEWVGLADRALHYPNQMSGGQQQRVAIARALVTQPRLILADEPTGNLDSRTSLEIVARFQALGRLGITLMLVTHEPDIAQYASRVIEMRDGKIVSDEPRVPRIARPGAGAEEAVHR